MDTQQFQTLTLDSSNTPQSAQSDHQLQIIDNHQSGGSGRRRRSRWDTPRKPPPPPYAASSSSNDKGKQPMRDYTDNPEIAALRKKRLEMNQKLKEMEEEMVRNASQYVDDGERRICIKHLPPSYNEDDVRTLFSQFGEIRWTTSVTGGRAGLSFAKHQQALNAIDSMNGRLLDGSTWPLGVCLFGTDPDPNPDPPPPPPPPPTPPRVVIIWVLIHLPPTSNVPQAQL